MTLEDLRAFVAAYEAKSMSEAARQLGCTQGAVAQHVRKLEQELGAELFIRMRRGVAPTTVGGTLYDAAQRSLATLGRATDEIEQAVSRQRECLRLSVSISIANRFLRRYVLALQERRPGMKLEVDPAHTAQERIESVRDGRSDLALVPQTSAVAALQLRSFRECELVLLVAAQHELAQRRRVKLHELASIRYIAQSHDSGTYLHLQRALRASGIELYPAEVTQDAASARLLVELGRGETFVPLSMARDLERVHRIKAIRVVDLEPLKMVWAARELALLPEVATEFMDICDELASA